MSAPESPTLWALVWRLFVAGTLVLLVVVGDRFPGYRAIDGPLIVELSEGRGVHVIDVALVVIAGGVLGWALAGMATARRRG